LIITEAGGLIGNFTGESDFLYQREVVAGTPKVYGQLVQILTPYTRVIKAAGDDEAGPAPEQGLAVADAVTALASGAPGALRAPGVPTPPATATKKAPTRIRKLAAADGDDAPM
jgi:myo-inositol-1(or 4)-monophosphatase